MALSTIIDAYCTLGAERETRLLPEQLLRMMDDAGIARAVVAPEDREIAVANTTGNRRIVDLARRWPERFIPACTVNPWFGAGACQELRRAVGDGARMLVLAPALQGFCLGDELADDVLRAAGELRVPVYVHTGPHSFGSPTQVVVAAAARPGVRFILGHCGSTDYAHDMPALIGLAPENVWFELSLVRPWAAASYVKSGDRRRFLFGTSAPRTDPAMELRHLRATLPIEEYPDAYGGNLTLLLAEAAR